ncbi:hypothetical protein HMPREF1624_04197 [Sporothrix schenckii ATCC 58251]|uniref:Uncharacterized protein n=1 Tax=Sporothrix schenckii (strain ATCC 58251 / de Perez 2211183) TaxID=1391915 RepID=U7PTU3_SPOS1|nr:hypothetical protein HMPREF1624_04197 [Sporothrix schenckii ATCC 58251]
MEQWYGTAPGLPVSSSPRVVHVRPVRPHRPLPTLPIKVKMEPESDDEKPSAWESPPNTHQSISGDRPPSVMSVWSDNGTSSSSSSASSSASGADEPNGSSQHSNWRPRRPPPTPLRDLDSLDAWETSLQATLRYHGLAGFLDEGGGGDAKPTHRDSLAYAQ